MGDINKASSREEIETSKGGYETLVDLTEKNIADLEGKIKNAEAKNDAQAKVELTKSLEVAKALLANYEQTLSKLDEMLKSLEEKETVIDGDYQIKITKLSNGQWTINGDINLVYSDKEDAQRDGEMVQRALKELKTIEVEDGYYDKPFYSGDVDKYAIFTHAKGIDDPIGTTRDPRTLAKSYYGVGGDVPDISALADLANKLFTEGNGDAKETSEMVKIKAELEDVKYSKQQKAAVLATGVIAGLAVGAPTGPGAAVTGLEGAELGAIAAATIETPQFEYDIKSDKEVVISSHGAAEIIFKKDGDYWIAEGSDGKLKYDTMIAASKDAVLMQELESIATQEKVKIEGEENGPFYSYVGDEISVHTDGMTDPDVSRSWINLSAGLLGGVGTSDLVKFMNDRYAAKMTVVKEREEKISDDGEIIERRKLVETLRNLKVTLPELGDPELMVIDKDHVEITTTYSSEPIKLDKVDGKWKTRDGNLIYGGIEGAVMDAVLVQTFEFDAKKEKDAITAGKENAPFYESAPGVIGLDKNYEDLRGFRVRPVSDVSNADFVDYLNSRWNREVPGASSEASDGGVTDGTGEVAPTEPTKPAEVEKVPDWVKPTDTMEYLEVNRQYGIEQTKDKGTGYFTLVDKLDRNDWNFNPINYKYLDTEGKLPKQIASPLTDKSGEISVDEQNTGERIFTYDENRKGYYNEDEKLVIDKDHPNFHVILDEETVPTDSAPSDSAASEGTTAGTGAEATGETDEETFGTPSDGTKESGETKPEEDGKSTILEPKRTVKEDGSVTEEFGVGHKLIIRSDSITVIDLDGKEVTMPIPSSIEVNGTLYYPRLDNKKEKSVEFYDIHGNKLDNELDITSKDKVVFKYDGAEKSEALPERLSHTQSLKQLNDLARWGFDVDPESNRDFTERIEFNFKKKYKREYGDQMQISLTSVSVDKGEAVIRFNVIGEDHVDGRPRIKGFMLKGSAADGLSSVGEGEALRIGNDAIMNSEENRDAVKKLFNDSMFNGIFETLVLDQTDVGPEKGEIVRLAEYVKETYLDKDEEKPRDMKRAAKYAGFKNKIDAEKALEENMDELMKSGLLTAEEKIALKKNRSNE